MESLTEIFGCRKWFPNGGEWVLAFAGEANGSIQALHRRFKTWRVSRPRRGWRDTLNRRQYDL